MQLTRLTACGFLVALAACTDAPAAPTELSAKSAADAKFTVLKPSEYAAHGIDASAFPSPPKPTPIAARSIQPCEIDYPESCNPPHEPLGVAHVDYASAAETLYAGQFTKAIWLHTNAEAHDNMQSTVLDVYYYVAGGCGPANSLFDSSHQVAYGSPVQLGDERVIIYDQSSVFTWKIWAHATYTANPRYVVDGVFQPSVDYPSADERCF